MSDEEYQPPSDGEFSDEEYEKNSEDVVIIPSISSYWKRGLQGKEKKRGGRPTRVKTGTNEGSEKKKKKRKVSSRKTLRKLIYDKIPVITRLNV